MTIMKIQYLAVLFFLIQISKVISQEHAPESEAVQKYTRVYNDSSGTSHFANEELILNPYDIGMNSRSVTVSSVIAAEGVRFFCFPVGTLVDWHPAPRRQLYFVLSGEMEMEVMDGEIRRFETGSVILGESTEGKGVRVRWGDKELGCVAVMPLKKGDPENFSLMERDQPAYNDVMSGVLKPTGPPSRRPIRTEAGESCIVDLTQSYTISGSISGTVVFNYRILVKGPCGSPLGTYDEEWIAFGEFDGKANDTIASGNMSYVATVKAGGAVDGQIVIGQGIEGELHVSGNFNDGKLSYKGLLKVK
jgi:quercetin dioxygenase-like cupin family protein